jgi:AcrR family transcriptional regulator
MTKKPTGNKPLARRVPRQARALEKVELILEAAIRLLESDGIEALTTNALAEKAGVSIGTLYQYFPDKNAVLAAIADREMTAMSGKIIEGVQAPPSADPGSRIRAILHAVLSTYGGRHRAHRMVMAHAMSRGGPNRLGPLLQKLIELSAAEGGIPGQAPISRADAFVLTHAIAGVVRTFVAQAGPLPPRDEVEQSLTRLVLNFVRAER